MRFLIGCVASCPILVASWVSFFIQGIHHHHHHVILFSVIKSLQKFQVPQVPKKEFPHLLEVGSMHI